MYGAVASNSDALVMLVDTLTQWAGLQSVSRCAQTGVVLHGTSSEQQGISECWLLKNEFDKCQAGGLPPPVKIPTEQEQRKAEEARKAAEEARKAAEEARKEEEKQKSKAEEDERAEHKEAGTLGLTEEMDLVTLTSRNEPGVSAGSSEEDSVAKAAREREERL